MKLIKRYLAISIALGLILNVINIGTAVAAEIPKFIVKYYFPVIETEQAERAALDLGNGETWEGTLPLDVTTPYAKGDIVIETPDGQSLVYPVSRLPYQSLAAINGDEYIVWNYTIGSDTEEGEPQKIARHGNGKYTLKSNPEFENYRVSHIRGQALGGDVGFWDYESDGFTFSRQTEDEINNIEIEIYLERWKDSFEGQQISPWMESDVRRAAALGLVPPSVRSGYTGLITRAEFCALAVTMYEAHIGRPINERKTFVDTDDPNVEKMAGLGVIDGDENGNFNPGGAFTREMAAVFFVNLLESEYVNIHLLKIPASFDDRDSIADWARVQVGQAQYVDLVDSSERDDPLLIALGIGRIGNLYPMESITREEGIVMFLKLRDTLLYFKESVNPIEFTLPDPQAIPNAEDLVIKPSLTKGMNETEFEQAYAVAADIACRYAKLGTLDQMLKICNRLHSIRMGNLYSMGEWHYSDIYGFFVNRVASCAGTTRAAGMCLTILGIEYEHINEDQGDHQWCRVNVDGEYWLLDAHAGTLYRE